MKRARQQCGLPERCILAVMFVLLLIGLLSPVLADKFDDCNNFGNRTATISGCSAIIDDVDSTPAQKIKAYVKRGNAHYMNRDYDFSIIDFDAALALDSNLPIALYRRGRSKLKKGQNDEAITDFDAALTEDPLHSFSLYGRAKAKEAKGDKKGAKKDIDDALGLNPELKAAKKDKDRLKNE